MRPQERFPGERGPRVMIVAGLVLLALFVAWLVSNAVRGNAPPTIVPQNGVMDLDEPTPDPGSPGGTP